MLDLGSEVQWFNTFVYGIFCFHLVKPLMPILALLPISFNYEKPRMDYVFLFPCMEVFMYMAFVDANGSVLLTMIKLFPNMFCTLMFWPTFVDFFENRNSVDST